MIDAPYMSTYHWRRFLMLSNSGIWNWISSDFNQQRPKYLKILKRIYRLCHQPIIILHRTQLQHICHLHKPLFIISRLMLTRVTRNRILVKDPMINSSNTTITITLPPLSADEAPPYSRNNPTPLRTNAHPSPLQKRTNGWSSSHSVLSPPHKRQTQLNPMAAIHFSPLPWLP